MSTLSHLAKTNMETSKEVLCNLRCMIGVELDETRLAKIKASLAGDERPFVGFDSSAGNPFTSDLPGDIAKRMVDAAKTVCHVTMNGDANLLVIVRTVSNVLAVDAQALFGSGMNKAN